MSNYNAEEELLLKKLMSHYLKGLLEDLHGHKKDTNSSFMFLDHKTIQLIIFYLLSNLNKKTATKEAVQNPPLTKEVDAALQAVIEQNHQEFEDIIHMLKE
ncbi:hypothetical protein Q7A53_14325 [Halobacillus rhizosphaerae]|uniref:hypothetical protein n=1 Tax=Halobacillus rhizosphaerae TaxID=3064889 RepID=UPI00398B89ED